MNCTIDKDILHLYIDGQLNPIEKLILQEHLAICPQCSMELNQLKILEWDLKNDMDIVFPSELKDIREALVNQCSGEETRPGLEMKDIYRLQYSTMKHSLSFVNYLPGRRLVSAGSEVVSRTIKSKQGNWLTKIMGL